jgi:hypothetical protein
MAILAMLGEEKCLSEQNTTLDAGRARKSRVEGPPLYRVQKPAEAVLEGALNGKRGRGRSIMG